MRRKKEGRVLGPYVERNGQWRIVTIYSNGYRVSKTYSSKDKAKRAMPKALEDMQSRLPLGLQIEPYLQTLTGRSLAATTVKDTSSLLYTMFDGEVAAQWHPDRVTATVEIWQKVWTVATQRANLSRIRRFWTWLQTQGKVKDNPFATVKICGRPNRGKPQLRLDEARRFVETAMQLYAAGCTLALAPVVVVAMGLRASEICDRVVRDVDDGGRMLWVPYGKTTNARRHLDVPEPLQPLLAELVRGRPPHSPLFGVNHKGTPWRRQTLYELVREICDRAGVPRACTHSLRGLWATLAVRSGAACEAVARALGHSSFAVTAKHYAKTDALDGARSDSVSGLLFPKPPA